MTNAMRAFRGAMMVALLPALALAQANPPAKAPAKAAAPAPARKAAAPAPAKKAAEPAHDMSAIKQGAPAPKQRMGGMKMDSKMPAMPGMTGGATEEMSGWKQLDAFHALLQLAWHPIGTGDYKPAREHGAHLLDAALAWRRSKGPASCDHAAFRKGMVDLMAETRSFADAVKRGGSDDAVQVTLARTHDAFEAIAEPCMMAGMKGMKMDAPKKP